MDNFCGYTQYLVKGMNYVMQFDKEDLLLQAKEHLKEEMTQISYSTWIQNLEIEDITENQIILKVNSIFQKEMLETRYLELIVNVFKYITNKSFQVSIILPESNTSNLKVVNTTPVDAKFRIFKYIFKSKVYI